MTSPRTQQTGGPRMKLSNLWTLPKEHMPALVVALIVAVVGPLFVASYSLGMGDPNPRNVPIGVVGDSMDATAISRTLDDTGEQMFEVSEYPNLTVAREAMGHQRIFAIIDPAAKPPTMWISSASGASVAQLLSQHQSSLSAVAGNDLQIVDAHPLAPHDPNGLVLFYLALGGTILGFVGAIQTRLNANKMTLAADFGWDAVRSLMVALTMTLVIGPVLGLEVLPVLPVWLILAATMFIAGAVYSFWRVTIGGRWALLPTWVTFVIIANPSSGGAVAPELLPPFYEFMGRWLPTGATVRAIRDVTYFPDAVHVEPFLVLGAWMVGSSILFGVVRVMRHGSGVIAPRTAAVPPVAPVPAQLEQAAVAQQDAAVPRPGEVGSPGSGEDQSASGATEPPGSGEDQSASGATEPPGSGEDQSTSGATEPPR